MQRRQPWHKYQSVERAYQGGDRGSRHSEGAGAGTNPDRALRRAVEHLEAELEKEHKELIRYHTGKLAMRIHWVLDAWEDAGEPGWRRALDIQDKPSTIGARQRV